MNFNFSGMNKGVDSLGKKAHAAAAPAGPRQYVTVVEYILQNGETVEGPDGRQVTVCKRADIARAFPGLETGLCNYTTSSAFDVPFLGKRAYRDGILSEGWEVIPGAGEYKEFVFLREYNPSIMLANLEKLSAAFQEAKESGKAPLLPNGAEIKGGLPENWESHAQSVREVLNARMSA